jgi:sn-glycerol 3-phosphate transport system substrate-binding protein
MKDSNDGPPTEGRAPLDRRHFLGYGALGLTAAALAACGGPSTSSGPSASSSATLDYSGVKPAKAIDFWSNHPGSSQTVEKQLVDAFNSSQSDIHVNLVTAGSSYEDVANKFQTAQAGGGLPGIVIFSDVWWFRYYLNQSIIPLDSLLKHLSVDTSDYQTTLYNDYSYGGQQWAVPYARSTPIFYYNKTSWSKAGLPDRAPTTWDEFAGWAKRLMSSDTGQKSAFEFGAVADYPAWLDQNNFWGWGGQYSDKFNITCDSPDSVAALEWIRKAIYEDKWATVASNAASDDFGAGATAATMSSTGSLVGIQKSAAGKFEIGVGFLPGGPKSTSHVCPTGGAGLGIPKKISPEEQLAAGTFLKFLTNPDNTVKFALATGYMPVRKSSNTASLIAKNPLIETAIKQLPLTRSQDWARVFLPSGDQILSNAIVSVTTQNQDPKAALSSAKSQLEQVYNSQVKPNLQ